MKKLGYKFFKNWVKIGLHLYFGKIKVQGLENVPKDTPVLFLGNHQSALLDVLLIGIDCKRDPYFLTRSDVFKKKLLKALFDICQMIPIYRIRDGRESLKNNQVVFDYCSELLIKKEAILMFPEANHSLKRRVRPLSKGFTRIIFNTLEKAPETDIQIIPIGLNYRDATSFPDKVAINFGSPISVKGLYDPQDEKASIDSIKEAVSKQLKILTTHIADAANYESTVDKLNALHVDYLKPKTVNHTISELQDKVLNAPEKKVKGALSKLFRAIFIALNFPMVFIWKKIFLPKVPEPEFKGTMRFGFALVTYPIYFAILFTVIALITNSMFALIAVGSLFLYNWFYVRLN